MAFDCETNSNGLVMFLAADANRNATWLYNADGLQLTAVLDWLIATGAGKLCVGFFFNYDVNQIVRLLPGLYIGQLAARGRVCWRGYKIRHVPGKQFRVTSARGSVTIWDVSGWAQCSFVKLIEEWKLGSEEERALVKAMKARRGDFDNATEQELARYTTLECVLLSQWVAIILQLHDDCSIRLAAYSGPGSTASAMIRASGWKPPEVDPRIQRIAESAFFGGRSEISQMGPIAGPIHSYDVNSAYPTAISELPEIQGARWFRARRFVAGAWGFYRVRWNQSRLSPWGLFPVRGALLPSGRKSISLLYPTEGVGWFHSYEVAAALEVAPDAVEIIDARLIEPSGRPFAWIGDVCATRLKYKAEKDQRAFPLKVGANSCYGKLAQHSGSHPLQCIAYAAAVTAHTRAQLLKLALRYGHDVLLLATDGILSRVPFPELEIGPGLGQWEYKRYDEPAWLVQAGVYWVGGKQRSRGIDSRALTLEQVDEAWRARKTRAEIKLSIRRVLSYRLCVSQNKVEKSGTWSEGVRKVRFSPAPRRRAWLWKGLRLLTLPATVQEYQWSAALDQALIDSDPGQAFDEYEAMPDWAWPED